MGQKNFNDRKVKDKLSYMARTMILMMLILGVDCYSKQGSVAIVRDGKPLYQSVYDSNMTHSQNLLSLI